MLLKSVKVRARPKYWDNALQLVFEREDCRRHFVESHLYSIGGTPKDIARQLHRIANQIDAMEGIDDESR